MAVDMIVENVGSTGTSVILNNAYHAKIDGDGKFRVKDESGRWSKYSPRMFNVLSDPDNQMANYGVSKTVTVSLSAKPDSTGLMDVNLEAEEAPIEEAPIAVSKEEYDVRAAVDKFTGAIPTPKIKKEEHENMKKSKTLREILVGQGVPEALVTQMNEYRKYYADPDMPEQVKARIPKPTELYEGGELWTDCITAVLAGKHILLSGGKATGKNTLTQSLAFAFQRPLWDMSFHSNIGKDEIVGSETFRDGNVVFNPGMAYMCGMYGGIGVLDEINMAKDNAISVLNSMLDDRRVIDVPGYERLHLHKACTFIGTMNYGYAGTRALNEALASRFVIPNVKDMNKNEVILLLGKKFPEAKKDFLQYFAGVFMDLQTKARNAEISTAAVDLRGIISALGMIEFGMSPSKAMTSNIVNKAFEEFERKIVQDVVNTRIPSSWTSADIFSSPRAFVVDMSGVK